MDTLSIIAILVLGLFVLILGIFGIKILFKIGKKGVVLVLNMILGFVFLFLVNASSMIEIPINILTILVAGFGGIIGVGVLVIAHGLGLF
jgi:inhibitor of the pro-sigma K processing machinery